MKHNRRTFLTTLAAGCAGFSGSLVPWPLGAAQAGRGALPRSTPEKQGVDPVAILNFLSAASQGRHEYHSVMILRHGRVVAEGWWHPYRPEAPQMLYSLSKSFTSTAMGLAVGEGRFSVQDRVVDFFPEQRPKPVSEQLAALRIKHLLSMSVGHSQDSTGSLWQQQDWARQFLSLPVVHTPGTVFLYNSGATYMLSAILQKVTGQTVLDYLQPRLFEPLGIEGASWERCPLGVDTGGWGLKVTTESLAKFGLLYLQRGQWRGRRLLPETWVQEATSFQIQQPATDLAQAKANSDWHQGYGYQFWRSRHDSYRGDGAYGQYVMVLPRQDAVVVVTSESPDMQGQMNLVWEHLLPGFHSGPLPVNRSALRALNERLAAASLRPPTGPDRLGDPSPIAARIFQEIGGPGAFWFEFAGEECVLHRRDQAGTHSVRCGLGSWLDGVTDFPGMPPKLTRGRGSDERWCKVSAAAAWQDARTLEMRWQFYETPHHATVTCKFAPDGGEAEIFVTDSLGKLGGRGPGLVLKGRAA